MKRKRNLAWHFVADKLRDGRPVPPDGVWRKHDGQLVMCKSGLHWSREPFDALQYAPGDTLCLVEVGGKIVEPKSGEHTDKGISTHRKIIVRMDANELLRYFARMQAISVLDNWTQEPDQCVLDWLMGEDSARSASRSASRSAASSAADSAAYWAAYSASRSAASSAAYSASRKMFNELVYECFEDWL